MSRYWRIYKSFFISSLRREMEFRANFIAKLFQNAMWIFFFVLILVVVFGKTNTIAGWTRGEAFVLAATCFLMNGLSSALFISLQDIPTQVRMGTMDFVITKPIDTQFWVSSRRFNFDQFGTLIAGFIMVGIGVASSGLHPDLLQWLAYTILVLSSLTLFYCFNLSLMTTGVWLVRVDNLWVLGESVMQVARYPMDIYQGGLQRFLTFIVPLAFLATVPAKQLVTGFNGGMLAAGIIWALAALFLSRMFWRYAMRHYSSASS